MPYFVKQRGLALITALSVLMVLSVLGVVTMNMVTTEEKMVFNLQDGKVAAFVAESAVKQVKLQVQTNALALPQTNPQAPAVTVTVPEADLPQARGSVDVRIAYLGNAAPIASADGKTIAVNIGSGNNASRCTFFYELISQGAESQAGTARQIRMGFKRTKATCR